LTGGGKYGIYEKGKVYAQEKCPMVLKYFRGLLMILSELEKETRRRRREKAGKDTSFSYSSVSYPFLSLL